jgi:hypothetical protein
MFEIIRFINKRSFSGKLITTLVLFLLIGLSRFCFNPTSIEHPVNDAKYFKAYVEYFRGEEPSYVIRPASNWRMLVPFIAAKFPFKPIIAINLVNLIGLALGLVFLYKSILLLGINEGLAWLGCWVFICSFPMFYYSAIGYIDPGVMPFISAGIYFTLRENLTGIIFCLIIGALAKETIIILLPFVLLFNFPKHPLRAISWTILLLMLFIGINILLRTHSFVSPGEQNPLFWQFSTQAILHNANRLNSYLAPMLSFGLPGLLFLWYSYKTGWNRIQKDPLFIATWGMFAGAIFLFGISVIATVCDGRIIWLNNYALIIVCATHLNNRLNLPF